MNRELEFERPVRMLERQIAELRERVEGQEDAKQKSRLLGQIVALEDRARKLEAQVFSGLSRWQVVKLARHPERPYTLDYVERGLTDFIELHGDRSFSDDPAIVCGLARLGERRIMLVGHQKGRNTQQNLKRNFGMPRPEGYRKALRLMKMAQRFRLPIVTLIDTPGAYPGLGAEERGQSQAIAEALEGMASLTVPVVSVVIGEGGSGGALAIGVANRVLMLENGTYSVISPEGCASILFKDAAHADKAAEALKLTGRDLLGLGVVDDLITEPPGGAHRDADEASRLLWAGIEKHLRSLDGLSEEALRDDRYLRFRKLGRLTGRVQIEPAWIAQAPSRPRAGG